MICNDESCAKFKAGACFTLLTILTAAVWFVIPLALAITKYISFFTFQVWIFIFPVIILILIGAIMCLYYECYIKNTNQ